MPAINSIVARDAMNVLAKRTKSWPARNSGVMVVFVIVFIVAAGLTGLFVSKKLAKRKANRPQEL